MVRTHALKIITSFALVAALAVSASAQTTVVALPADASGVVGSNNPAPGYSSGSWEANASAGTGNKSEYYIPASSLFSSPVTVGDIASISYFTNKPGNGGSPDWSFYMYTSPTGTDDSASWYHSRLTSEPYFSNATVASNTWHQWSSGGSNPMLFYDGPRSGTAGTYTDPTLAGIQSGTYLSHNYNNETVNLFSMQTGSAWGLGFTGLLDGLKITLNNGAVGIVNFEAVPAPEPASLAVWGAMSVLGAAFGWCRRRSS